MAIENAVAVPMYYWEGIEKDAKNFAECCGVVFDSVVRDNRIHYRFTLPTSDNWHAFFDLLKEFVSYDCAIVYVYKID